MSGRPEPPPRGPWAFLLLEEREGLLQDGGFQGEEAAAADLLRDEALPVF